MPQKLKNNTRRQGQAIGTAQFERATFQFAKPLSDPMGGTDSTGSRYPIKMKSLRPRGRAGSSCAANQRSLQ